jgi:hypothetical protein
VITVYLVTTATITSSSHDQDHAPRRRQQLHVEDRVVGLFDGLPVVLYKLARRDFLRHGSLPGLSCHHHCRWSSTSSRDGTFCATAACRDCRAIIIRIKLERTDWPPYSARSIASLITALPPSPVLSLTVILP